MDLERECPQPTVERFCLLEELEVEQDYLHNGREIKKAFQKLLWVKEYPAEYRNEAAGKRSFFNLGDIL